MKLGIGVTTYQRPTHIALWNEQMKKHIPSATIPHEVYIATDTPMRMGIAYRKNECLKALKDCDYIFLFDDDCFPIRDGWADYFINVHKVSGQHHFLYLGETATIKQINKFQCNEMASGNWRIIYINSFDNCGGAFMFLTKEVIKKVGGYNKGYGYYGFEHAGFTDRIHQAGLTPYGKYLCPSGAGEYLYAMDYNFHLPFNVKVKHQSSLMNEMGSVKNYIEQNRKVYLEDIKTIYKPL